MIISNENSRSITRNPFLFPAPFSKFKIWQSKFSISSRSARYRRYKSRSRLEQHDYKNLDLVSKKTRWLFIFFAEIFCAIILKQMYCFFHPHMAFIHISPTPSHYFHFHSTSGEPVLIIAQCLEKSWTKVKVELNILQLNCPQSTIAFHGGFVCTYQHRWDRYFDDFLILSMYLLNKKDTNLKNFIKNSRSRLEFQD